MSRERGRVVTKVPMLNRHKPHTLQIRTGAFMKIVIFDTETTGLLLPKAAPIEKQPKIIELGVIVVTDGVLTGEHNWLINPGEEISAEITKITGIKNEQLHGLPSFKDQLDMFKDVFKDSDIGVCHNAPFDTGMMKNDLARAGCEDFPWPAETMCTVQEYMHVFGKRAKLTQLYEHFMGKPLAQTHRALDDAHAVYEVLLKDGFFDKMSGA